MATFFYSDIGISALSACVPKNKIVNLKDTIYFPTGETKAIVDKIGVLERRVATRETCASDLGFSAAEALFKQTGIPRDSIDFLIFVSQTPDYRMPATAIVLQHRLGLPKSVAAFDINLGCTGFVFGLNTAYSLVSQQSIKRILLINAETRTKVYSFKDRKTGLLFGDAATACIVEKLPNIGNSYFKLDSDGEKADYIMIKAGGYRFPSTEESVKEKVCEDGNIRSDEQGFMNGYGVFEFVLSEVPRHIEETLQLASLDKHRVDYIVLHQANVFMNQHLVKKLKLNPQKVPQNIDRYGNTSSVSIPLAIVTELKEKLTSLSTILISGFGVGLSLGSAVIKMASPQICPLVEY